MKVDLLQGFSSTVLQHPGMLQKVCSWAMGLWGGTLVGDVESPISSLGCRVSVP